MRCSATSQAFHRGSSVALSLLMPQTAPSVPTAGEPSGLTQWASGSDGPFLALKLEYASPRNTNDAAYVLIRYYGLLRCCAGLCQKCSRANISSAEMSTG